MRVLSKAKLNRCGYFELLESRLNLSVVGCESDAEVLSETSVDRAAHAINCLAFDLHEQFQQVEGNVVYSPLSISTVLAMAHSGAAGATASQMQTTLHLGSDPGIDDSYRLLFEALDAQDRYDILTANGVWPRDGVPVAESYIERMRDDYFGEVERLDYSDTESAKETINDWVFQETNGKIEDLIDSLSPETLMVLTNSIYFRAQWAEQFSPHATGNIGMGGQVLQFVMEDGTVRDVPFMRYQASTRSRIGNFGKFQVLEMPYEGDQASMVFIVPWDGFTTDDVTPDEMSEVQNWLATESSPNDVDTDFCGGFDLHIPKFKSTVSTKLAKLLQGMGMPRAFGVGGPADFSGIFGPNTDNVEIDQVGHQAFLEINEQGTEAAAATFATFYGCFAKGTPVLTPDGEKPIEELKVGDLVLSRDDQDQNGELEPKVIEKTFQRHSPTIVVQVDSQEIRTTKEHPFFVKGQGWTRASDLRVGDLLASDMRSWKPVSQISHDDEDVPVYNLRVADHHTYFIGGKNWGFSLWVHNIYAAVQFTVDRPFHYFIRDNATSSILFMGRMMDPLDEEGEFEPVANTIGNPLPGDANGDRVVDFADFLVLSEHYGRNEEVTFADGDFNGDGTVNFTDFLIFARNFHSAQPR